MRLKLKHNDCHELVNIKSIADGRPDKSWKAYIIYVVRDSQTAVNKVYRERPGMTKLVWWKMVWSEAGTIPI